MDPSTNGLALQEYLICRQAGGKKIPDEYC